MSFLKNTKRFTLLASLLVSTVSLACTGIQLKAKDGAFVNGRTVEFGIDLDLSAIVVPRNYEFKGTLPKDQTGITYRAKYAAVGANTFGTPSIVDGINEKGLSVGMFYFPGFATYSNITPENKDHALSPIEFPNWILTQFATVQEVKENIDKIIIAPTSANNWGGVPPFHYIVYDKAGDSITIEPIDGHLKVYNNPVGVLTNSPAFDWHLTNLANYINLSPINATAVTVDGLKLKQFGQGSGMHGLPGDFTPPSRFVRAALFSSTALPSETVDQTVLQMFHILNQFDIPVGAVREVENNKVINEATIATTVKDTRNLKYYFRTYDDQTIKMINLKSFDLDAKELKTIAIKGTQPIVDVTSTAK